MAITIQANQQYPQTLTLFGDYLDTVTAKF